MSDLAPRSGQRLSRRAREQRAYRLVLIGGAAGAVAVVGLVLAIVGIIGLTIPVIAFMLTAVAVVLFARTVSR